jgi:hypothetical protein
MVMGPTLPPTHIMGNRLLSPGLSCQLIKLATEFRFVQNLRMSEALLPIMYMSV